MIGRPNTKGMHHGACRRAHNATAKQAAQADRRQICAGARQGQRRGGGRFRLRPELGQPRRDCPRAEGGGLGPRLGGSAVNGSPDIGGVSSCVAAADDRGAAGGFAERAAAHAGVREHVGPDRRYGSRTRPYSGPAIRLDRNRIGTAKIRRHHRRYGRVAPSFIARRAGGHRCRSRRSGGRGRGSRVRGTERTGVHSRRRAIRRVDR